MRAAVGFLLTVFVVLATGRAIGLSWIWAAGWALTFGVVAAVALLAAKTARPRNPVPWMVAAAVVSLVPVAVAIVRRSFDVSAILSGALCIIFLAGAVSARRKTRT